MAYNTGASHVFPRALSDEDLAPEGDEVGTEELDDEEEEEDELEEEELDLGEEEAH